MVDKAELEVIKESLLRYDEITVLDLLDISVEDIIERFEDLIEDNYDKIKSTIEEETSGFSAGFYTGED